MNTQSEPSRKPYVAPRVQEQGKVADVTSQSPPTTPLVSSALGTF